MFVSNFETVKSFFIVFKIIPEHAFNHTKSILTIQKPL